MGRTAEKTTVLLRIWENGAIDPDRRTRRIEFSCRGLSGVAYGDAQIRNKVARLMQKFWIPRKTTPGWRVFEKITPLSCPAAGVESSHWAL